MTETQTNHLDSDTREAYLHLIDAKCPVFFTDADTFAKIDVIWMDILEDLAFDNSDQILNDFREFVRKAGGINHARKLLRNNDFKTVLLKNDRLRGQVKFPSKNGKSLTVEIYFADHCNFFCRMRNHKNKSVGTFGTCMGALEFIKENSTPFVARQARAAIAQLFSKRHHYINPPTGWFKIENENYADCFSITTDEFENWLNTYQTVC